jgi:hypothetical protein
MIRKFVQLIHINTMNALVLVCVSVLVLRFWGRLVDAISQFIRALINGIQGDLIILKPLSEHWLGRYLAARQDDRAVDVESSCPREGERKE